MTNGSGDVLLIVVDKRVDISLNGGGEARDVELVLYNGKVLKANLLLLMMVQCSSRFRMSKGLSGQSEIGETMAV